MISIITPAFNEAGNLPALHARIADTMSRLGVEWEWLVIDDHSTDETFGVLQRLAAADPRVRGFRFARNAGSHVAIACGLHQAAGDAAVMMAADLQDPPETLGAMLERWRSGAQVVWATRRQQPSDRSHAGFAAAYYWVMRHVVGLREMPARGADFFLADRVVVEEFRRFPERNTSVFALLTWIGFRQEYIEYDKQPRLSGQSGWTLARKVKLVMDSVAGFSNAPIQWCVYAGTALVAMAIVLFIAGLVLLPSLGAGLMIVLAVVIGLGGVQLLALGIIGEYVWRALDEARRRPPYVLEAITAAARRVEADL